ncbi:MAG: polyprenyl synthetase family protein [Bacteroidetes bacterium]|nr:polyprenyl synthetase family protein [Bacteroidota bacterium]MBP6316029.1 polyprenyl synthetase family protein [Chitinophagaceae bacterium]
MHSYTETLDSFETFFAAHEFPSQPKKLYEPCSYLLRMGGKRIRPVLCLMSHELFAELNENVWHTATAIELFHNFTLMHDDIMDKAPLRRGFATVHEKYDLPTAILSGDVMSIFSYVHLNKINTEYIHSVMELFNRTAIEICEGQQMDMDFESENFVSLAEYMKMITLKTSVLIGASMKLGAMLGGATDGCSDILYQFGKSMGLAFQMKDDYLDAFGDSSKTGKQIGGDILSNKKTFLLSKAFEIADSTQREALLQLLQRNDEAKVADTLSYFEKLHIKELLEQEIQAYTNRAYELLEKVPVISKRKVHLNDLAKMLLNRES